MDEGTSSPVPCGLNNQMKLIVQQQLVTDKRAEDY